MAVVLAVGAEDCTLPPHPLPTNASLPWVLTLFISYCSHPIFIERLLRARHYSG